MTEEFPFSMTTEEAARYLRMPVGKLKWLVRRCEIRVHRNAGWRFERPELDRWLADQKS
jgi:excisionase family DNA binding protein